MTITPFCRTMAVSCVRLRYPSRLLSPCVMANMLSCAMITKDGCTTTIDAHEAVTVDDERTRIEKDRFTTIDAQDALTIDEESAVLFGAPTMRCWQAGNSALRVGRSRISNVDNTEVWQRSECPVSNWKPFRKSAVQMERSTVKSTVRTERVSTSTSGTERGSI